MPSLRVMRNGEHLCTIGSYDVWMVSAALWSELWGPELATLDVSGGGTPKADGDSDLLIWEAQREIQAGDRLGFGFNEGDVSAPPGRVFDPAAAPEMQAEPALTPANRQPLAAPARWSVFLDGIQIAEHRPDAERQHMSCKLIWNARKPETLRMNLSRASVEEILNRQPGEHLFLGDLPLGSQIEIQIAA